MAKRYRGISDSQANAEALARRSAPYAQASATSFRVAWDWHRREPADLREAVRMVRKAYQDEVPTKLHEAAIGDDGTPRMTPRAEGYIFGSETADDAGRDPETGQRDMIGYYRSPFRARLAEMERRDEAHRHDAAIIRRIAIGGQSAVEATIAEGIPDWAAPRVAEPALRSFLRNLTDVKVHTPKQEVAESQSAA